MTAANPMIPTPKTPASSEEEARYRGVALQQLDILRQQMRLGGLTQGKRTVDVGGGVTIKAVICFNDERVYALVPAQASSVTSEVLAVYVCAYSPADDYATGFFSDLSTYKLFKSTGSAVTSRAFTGEYGNVNWIGSNSVLSWMGPLTRYTSVTDYTVGLSWWLGLGGGEGGSVLCNFTPLIFSSGKQLAIAPSDADSLATGTWAGYHLVVGAGIVSGKLAAVLYRESSGILVVACLSAGEWRYAQNTISIPDISLVSSALFGWGGQVVINTLPDGQGRVGQRLEGTISVGSDGVPEFTYNLINNSIPVEGADNFSKVKTDFYQEVIASTTNSDYYHNWGIMASYYAKNAVETLAVDYKMDTRRTLTKHISATSSKERTIDIYDEVPEYSYGSTYTPTSYYIIYSIRVITSVYEVFADGISYYIGAEAVTDYATAYTWTSAVTIVDGVEVREPWVVSVTSYGTVPPNTNLGTEGDTLTLAGKLLLDYGNAYEYEEDGITKTGYTMTGTGYTLQNLSTTGSEGITTPPTIYLVHADPITAVDAVFTTSIVEQTSLDGVVIDQLTSTSGSNFAYLIDHVTTRAYVPEITPGSVSEQSSYIRAVDLRSGTVIADTYSYAYDRVFTSVNLSLLSATYDIQTTTTGTRVVISDSLAAVTTPLPSHTFSAVAVAYDLPSIYSSGTSFDGLYVTPSITGLAGDIKCSITAGPAFKGFAAEVLGEQIVYGATLQRFDSIIFGGDPHQINPISLI